MSLECQRKEFLIEKQPIPPPLPRDSQEPFTITVAEAWVLRDLLYPLVQEDRNREQTPERAFELRRAYTTLDRMLNPNPIGWYVWEEPLCAALMRCPDPEPRTPEEWDAHIKLGVDECLTRGLFLRKGDLTVGMKVLAPTLMTWCVAEIKAVDPPSALSGEHHAIFLEYRKDRGGICCVSGSGNLKGLQKLEMYK